MRFPVSKPTITELEESYVRDALASGWVSSTGDYIRRFEDGFARFCGVEHCVSVSNGTVGLFLALKAVGVGPGAEVIVPDFSFIATANVVTHVGATPVFVDIDPDTLCMSAQAFKAAISEKTRAVMPVHVYGHPAPMFEIVKIARSHGIFVLEDCAEAHGAAVLDRSVGAWGDTGVFSFYGNKILTTGEGGAIVLRDRELADRLKLLRDHAMSRTRRYWHEEAGYNFRLTNLQAALGVAQLTRAREILDKKRKIFEWYVRELADVPGIRLNHKASWAEPVYWMVCLELDSVDAGHRYRFMSRLKEDGIDTRPYFYPMSSMPMYKAADTPISHAVSARGINLPSYFDLNKPDVVEICRAIRESLKCIRS